MHIQKLEFLVEVAKTGSFSIAAENLHVSKSGISQAISKIEEKYHNSYIFDYICQHSPSPNTPLIYCNVIEKVPPNNFERPIFISTFNTSISSISFFI